MIPIPSQGSIAVSDPFAELAANMAAFKVDTEVRREEAAEAREGAFQGADRQEKNTAIELLKENKALADLYAQAQKELEELKAQYRKTDVDNKHEIAVLKGQLTEERATKTLLKQGVEGVIKVLEEKNYTASPIEPDRKEYYRYQSPFTAEENWKEDYQTYLWLGKLHKVVNDLEDKL